MLLNLITLLPLVAAYNTFQNAATVDPKTFTATTEDGKTLLIDTYNFKTWSMEERQYVGQWNPFDKLRTRANDTGIDMMSHFRDESGNLLGIYDEKTGEITSTSNGKVVGHANDTGFFDMSGVRRGLALDNSTRQFYAPDQSFIGGLFVEPKVGPGSDGFTWDSLNKDYKDIAATIGPKAGVVRDLSGFLSPRTRFYIRDKEFGDGAELVYLRNNTLDTLQIETDYTYQLNLSRISVDYTMSVDTGRFDFGDNEDDFIQYSNSSMMFNNELWGMFMKQTAFGPEVLAVKSDLDLSPIANLSFIDYSNKSVIGGVYNQDIILDNDNNLLYRINPNTLVVSNGSMYKIGTFNTSDYTIHSISPKKGVIGQVVLKSANTSNDKSGSGAAGAGAAGGSSSSGSSDKTSSSTSSSGTANTNGAGSTLPTAAAALVIPFFLLMV